MPKNMPGGFRSIRLKMCLTLLPAIAVGLLLITVLAGYNSYNNISEMAEQSMNQTIRANTLDIHERLERMNIMCGHLAGNVEYDYRTETPEELGRDIVELLDEEPLSNGGGIWFEKFGYRPEVEYLCPFAFRENGKLKLSYNYVTESGEYFNEEWYQKGKAAGQGKTALTEPYFDPVAKIMMVTYASPVHAVDQNRFIGVVTVDMSLASVADIINDIKVGETGHAILTSANGIYIAGVDGSKLNGETNATEEKNASVAAAMKQMISSEVGQAEYTDDDGRDMLLYYQSVPDSGWHLGLVIPKSELYASANRLIMVLAGIAVLVLLVLFALTYRTISSYATRIGVDQKFAEDLADGDYTRPEAVAKANDEIGLLGNAINKMFRQTKGVLHTISEHSGNMKDSSEILGTSAEKLSAGMVTIQENMRSISEAMMNASSATEEINASVEDVSTSASVLSTEAASGLQQAEDIRLRAQQVKQSSLEARQSAEALAKEFSSKLELSIEQSKAVEEIGMMATAISGIAEQINLLSLNASIEAARAGEFGRGFTVVAAEIGKLAKSTAETVEQIQTTIRDVQNAFENLSGDAKAILGFLNETVAPQYDGFVGVAEQYGQDAEEFHDISQKISDISKRVNDTMEQVSRAMAQIANAAQDTADLSVRVADSVNEVSDTVTDVNGISQQQSSIAESLRESVSHFKLKK